MSSLERFWRVKKRRRMETETLKMGSGGGSDVKGGIYIKIDRIDRDHGSSTINSYLIDICFDPD